MRHEINSSQTAQILIWFLFVVAVLSSLARLGTKYGMNAKFGFDDGFLLAALVSFNLFDSSIFKSGLSFALAKLA